MSESGAPMECSEAVMQLWDYLDHAISPVDQERIEQHLSFCRSCCGELEFAKEIRAFLARSDVRDIPSDVRARLEGFVQDL